MTRAAWAMVRMEKAFKRWENGEQFDGWLSPFANELTKEHRRAVRVVKRKIADLEVIKSRSFCNAEIAEAYASITVLRDILAALQKGRK